MKRVYLASPLTLRFGYTFWVLLGGLYIYSNYYDKLHGLKRTRELHRRNFPLIIYIAGGLTLSLYFAHIVNNWRTDMWFVPTVRTILVGAGFVLLGLGLFCAGWGRASMNGLWGANIYRYPDNTDHLVRRSAYSYVRHPIYIGHILMAWGTLFVAEDCLFLIFSVLITVFDTIRAINEDKDLATRFPEEFEKYKNTISFMIPL
jgi:protein-S-isoprenylcysteine O-methyltransferase Ste14